MAVAFSTVPLLAGPQTEAIRGDLTRPEEILGAAEVLRLIDFDRPVALLIVATLHFIPDEADPAGAVVANRLQADQVRKFAGAGPPLLDNGDAVGHRDRPGVDRIDALRAEPAEESRQQRRGQN